MTPEKSDEKAKPFRLVKYFTFTSLIVIFMGTLLLSFLNTHWARAMQIEKSEEYALVLIENLNHQVFLQFIIPVALKFGKIQLRNKEQFERMDMVVRSTLHSFKVDMVHIYDMNNIISYSFDSEMVGKRNLGGEGWRKAVEGKSNSMLVYPENEPDFFSKAGFFIGVPRKSKIVTFAPLRAEKPLSRISGPVLGVVEIVQDLSEDYNAIFRFQIRVILTCAAVMGLLFAILRLTVNRGELIIEKRNREQIRLKEQLSRAERLSALGEMVAGISHEIRNPLGIIRSSAELLKKKMLKFDPSNTIPDIIVEEASRLNNIITDFLNFAKPRNPNPLPCHADEILEKSIAFLGSQLKKHNCVIEKDFSKDRPEIMADSAMIYQAFLNIMLNAVQAMPGGGIIRIETVSDAKCVTVIFKDEGTGIPDDVMGKIWDPFFTTKETGTGLGLGIVKNIVESHGGKIRLENRKEKGAAVFVELPAGKK
ncbi:MAG: two-component sensor histidine kinase [Desulfobacteraceae bacterium IS3]|nr:MAG: two-component sensor histidine kinase [Desulfobacteraceae bacterium IS3]